MKKPQPLSREFLLKRGFCCNNGCINCPYKIKSEEMPSHYKEYIIDILNEEKFDERFTSYSDNGRAVVVVGKIAVLIDQSEDGKGVAVEVLDSDSMEQEFGRIEVLFQDVK